jgi:hypothetical protein
VVWGLVLLNLVLLVYTPGSAADVPALSAERCAAFLDTLAGAWSGQATVTPVGPRPYDMTFTRTLAGGLEGAAHPGASTHFWTFSMAEQTLRLRFLSTFAGNRQPLFLTATAEHEGAVVFRTQPPPVLEVHVKPLSDTLDILIFLRHQPHVEIHLTRLP